MARLLKAQALGWSLINALAPKARATHNLVYLEPDDREVFRAHLLRLDEQTRRERFGSFFLDDAFIDRYVQNINFANTVLIGILLNDVLRASAELRSLESCWAKQAELSIIVEQGWQGCEFSAALFRRAVSRAQEVGVTELFINCNAKERSVRFLRLLGKELRSGTPLHLTALDLFTRRDEESGPLDSLIRVGLESRRLMNV